MKPLIVSVVLLWTSANDAATKFGSIVLYGFTKEPIARLLPLARSWNHPPDLADPRGGDSQGYDKAQRAYVLTAAGQALSFRLEASESSPAFNPAFVIQGWGAGGARLRIDGKEIPRGPAFRYGHRRRLDGTDLVVWIRTEATKPVRFAIKRAAAR